MAAIPSVHAGWAAAVGWGIWRYTTHWLPRAFAVAYPVAVFLTIIVTGNHFVLDAVAGVAVLVVGFGVVGRRRGHPRRFGRLGRWYSDVATRGGAVR